MTLFAPNGTALATERQTVRLPNEYMKMLAAFALTSGDIDIGLHCSRCKQDITGQNGQGDTLWRMECACRTYVGTNPIGRGN